MERIANAPRNVFPVPMLFGISRALTGSSSKPKDTLRTHCAFSSPQTSSSLRSGVLASSPMVFTFKPSASSRPNLAPKPRMRSMGNSSKSVDVWSGQSTVCDAGLFIPLVSLASILFNAMPALKVYPSSSTHALRRLKQMYAPAARSFSSSRHSLSSLFHHAADASSGGRGRKFRVGSSSSFAAFSVAASAVAAFSTAASPAAASAAPSTGPSVLPARSASLLTYPFPRTALAPAA